MLNRLKGILYDTVLMLARLGGRKKPSRKLLILRTDEIGDYLLWRKFLPEIAAAYRHKNYEVHFLGNSSFKSIYTLLDDTSADQTIWMNKIAFKKSLLYRYRLLRQIHAASYETVINPIFSRDKRNDDAIVRAAKAIHRIGMKANPEAVKPYERGYDKNLYTRIFDIPEKPLFEFYRNKLFTGFITGEASLVRDTCISKVLLPALPAKLINSETVHTNLSGPDTKPSTAGYFVVFPGSRSEKRRWPVKYFITVSNYLYDQYQLTAVLCGSTADQPFTDEFEKQYQYPVINLTGETSLPEMLSVLALAKCLLSVDTGSVHLAAAVGCTVFGIFNGSQYKRFAPYPVNLNNRFFAAYPDQVEAELNDPVLVLSKYEFTVNIPYESVQPEKIIQLIQTHL